MGAHNSAASLLLDVVPSITQERAMADVRFVISEEKARLPNGRVIVRGTRTSTSSGTRSKKHVFIEVECDANEADAVLTALTVILQQRGRIEASIF